MLKNTNRLDKNKSKYECDKCKKIVTLENKYTIYISKGKENQRKKWDLCEKCYNLLNNFISGSGNIPKTNNIQPKDLKKAKKVIQNRIELNNSLIRTAKQVQKDADYIRNENNSLETIINIIENIRRYR